MTSFNDGYFICFFYMRRVSLAKSEGEYFSYQSSKSIYTCSTLICTKMLFYHNIVCTIKSKKQFYKIISTSFKLACILTLVWTIENKSLFLYWAIWWWSTNWWNKKEWIFFNSFQQISYHNPLKKNHKIINYMYFFYH